MASQSLQKLKEKGQVEELQGGLEADTQQCAEVDPLPWDIFKAVKSRDRETLSLLLSPEKESGRVAPAVLAGALREAVRLEDRATVRLLLAAGADVNLRSEWFTYPIEKNLTFPRSPLEVAEATVNPEIRGILLDAGGDIRSSTKAHLPQDTAKDSSLGGDVNKRRIRCDWELPLFIASHLNDKAGNGDSPNVEDLVLRTPTLTAKHNCIRFRSCEAYLREHHGMLGVKILKSLISAIFSLDGKRLESELLGMEIETTANKVQVNFSGLKKVDNTGYMSRIVVWICMTFRQPIPETSNFISSGTLDGSYFKLFTLRPLQETSTTCWNALFRSAVIAVEDPDALSPELWLDINFKDMLQITAVEYPVSVASGLVFMGYSTALIPIQRRGLETIQWHLEVADHDGQLKTCELCATKGPWLQVQSLDSLVTEKALIGWCPRATIMLGTDYHNDIKWSGAQTKQTSWHWTGTNLQLLAQSAAPVQVGAQMGFSFSRSRNTVQFSPSDNYLKCLRNSGSEQMVLYDTTQGRAWVVPLVCVLHQMLLCYAKTILVSQGSTTMNGVPHAEPKDNHDGSGSLKALQDNSSNVVEVYGEAKLTVRDLVMGFSANLSKTSLHKPKPNGRKIYGYELMDIVMDSPQSDLKLAQVEKSGLAWLPFLNNIPCLFCSDIGDVITGKRALCSDSPCNRVPQNYDLLAASTASIKALGLRFGDRLDFSGISTSHASYRVSPSATFQQCQHGTSGQTCWELPAFLQEVQNRKSDARGPTTAIRNFPEGAMIFGSMEAKESLVRLVGMSSGKSWSKLPFLPRQKDSSPPSSGCLNASSA